MKTVILFDTNPLSLVGLQEACRNACQLGNEPNRVLLLTFNCLSGAVQPEAAQYSWQTTNLLRSGLEQLECWGRFAQIEGEVISCKIDNLTDSLIARVREWQTDVIYLAQAPLVNPTVQPNSWVKKTGIKYQTAPVISANPLPGNFTCAEIGIKTLLERSKAQVALVTPEGLTLKLSYYGSPRKKVTTRAKTPV